MVEPPYDERHGWGEWNGVQWLIAGVEKRPNLTREQLETGPDDVGRPLSGVARLERTFDERGRRVVRMDARLVGRGGILLRLLAGRARAGVCTFHGPAEFGRAVCPCRQRWRRSGLCLAHEQHRQSEDNANDEGECREDDPDRCYLQLDLPSSGIEGGLVES
jgi:hypothetical protein